MAARRRRRGYPQAGMYLGGPVLRWGERVLVPVHRIRVFAKAKLKDAGGGGREGGVRGAEEWGRGRGGGGGSPTPGRMVEA